MGNEMSQCRQPNVQLLIQKNWKQWNQNWKNSFLFSSTMNLKLPCHVKLAMKWILNFCTKLSTRLTRHRFLVFFFFHYHELLISWMNETENLYYGLTMPNEPAAIHRCKQCIEFKCNELEQRKNRRKKTTNSRRKKHLK